MRKILVNSACSALAALVLGAPPAQGQTSSDWAALSSGMTAPWPALQLPDGSFVDYVFTHSHRPPPAHNYGSALLGYALLQNGLRNGDGRAIAAGLRALRYGAIHPAPTPRVIFQSLALVSAYNLARAGLPNDPRFAAVRGVLANRLRRIRPVVFGSGRGYYNFYLVEAVELLELTGTGLRSTVPHSALSTPGRARRLAIGLVDHTLPRLAARYTTRSPAGPVTVLSDPPWNPPAYQAFSLAMLARAVKLLGPQASHAARELLRRAARAVWALTSPDGDVAYFGRSQEESFVLSTAAYGEEAAAALPGTSAPDAQRFRWAAARQLERLQRIHAGGPYGLFVTPALRTDLRSGIAGLDNYVSGVAYTGLTAAGLNWALAEGVPAEDSGAPGSLALGVGPSRLVVLRSPHEWLAVKQGPGTGQYSDDMRYDAGLVALKRIAPDGSVSEVVPLRPRSAQLPGVGPLLRGGRLWGTHLSLRAGAALLTGGFRRGDRWLRRGVRVRYEPVPCGLRVTLPTRRGDRLQQSFFFRGRPRVSRHGRLLSDGTQAISLSRPAHVGLRPGYTSGAEVGLVRARLRLRGDGRPLRITYCSAGP